MPIANQKYSSLVLPNRYALIARPQQYKGAKVIIMELINIAIGIKLKPKITVVLIYSYPNGT